MASSATSIADDATSYRVEHGDTLSAIALHFYGDASLYGAIFEENRDQMNSPDHLFSGQRIRIPREPDTALAEDREVSIATSDDYVPYSDSRLKGHGAGPMLAESLFERAGYDVTLTVLDTWEEVEQAVKDKDFDVGVPYARTDDREHIYDFSDGFIDVTTRAFVRSDDQIPSRFDSEDLAGRIVCKPHDYFTSDIDHLVAAGHVGIILGRSPLDCFDRLLDERADVVVLNRFTGWATIQDNEHLGTDAIDMLEEPMGTVQMGIMVSKDHASGQELLEDFNESLEGASALISETNRELREDFAVTFPDLREVMVNRPYERSAHGEPVHLVSGNNYYPFSDEELPSQGMVTDIVTRAFEDHLERPVEIAFKSWVEGAQAVLDGEYDATFPYVRTEDRRSDYAFSDMLYGMAVQIYVRDGDPLEEYRGIMDLEDYVACKPEGYYRQDLQEALDRGLIQIVEASDEEACFQRLVEGEADLVTMNRFTAEAAVDRAPDVGDDDVREVEGAIAQMGLHLMVSREDGESRELLEAFDEAIKEMRSTGELQEIQDKHLEDFQGG
nr:transporter substrate-binding domain-containing protein [Halorhodospira sp. 9622]